MSKIEKFEDINSWKMVREITNTIYDLSSQGDFAKDFTLVNQIRRSAISIMSNSAEGFESGGDKEFINFLSIAKGSCGETRSQIYIAFDRKYISREQFDSAHGKLTETGSLIGGFMNYLKESDLRRSKFK